MRLYRSAVHPGQWLAYGKEIGWVVFPAHEQGWEERRSARGIDPVHLREVPLHLAVNAGVPHSSPQTQAQTWRPQRAA